MAIITFPDATYPEAITDNLVTGGDSHDHSGGDGAQIAHSSLSGAGTTSHGDIDSHVGAASPHSGHATLSTGKIPTSELGSGEASSSVYLRGDQTWATPAGGSGGAPPTWMPPDILWKDADELYLPSGRYYKSSTDRALTANFSDLTPTSNNTVTYLVVSIETAPALADYIPAADTFNTYRFQKIAVNQYNGGLLAIEDTTSAADTFIIDGDKVGGSPVLAVGDWLQMVPPSTVPCVYLGDVFCDGSSTIRSFLKRGDRYTWNAEAYSVPSFMAAAGNSYLGFVAPPTARAIDMALDGIRNGDELYFHYMAGSSGGTRHSLFGFESGTNTNFRLAMSLDSFPLSAVGLIRGFFNTEPGTGYTTKARFTVSGFEE